MDEGRVTAITLLDLSAAFDTLDHNSITNLLSTWYVINGIALEWLVSHLSDRKQKVKLMDVLSSRVWGSPRIRLWPIVIYSLHYTPPPLSYVIQRHPDIYITRDIEQMLLKCWACVVDGGPTLQQHLFNVPCLLGFNLRIKYQDQLDDSSLWIKSDALSLIYLYIDQESLQIGQN